MFSCEFWEFFKNNYFVEYLPAAAFESVRYQVYILFLEQGEEYKNYLKMICECFSKLFVLVKDDITK